jgi:hypothetical protein
VRKLHPPDRFFAPPRRGRNKPKENQNATKRRNPLLQLTCNIASQPSTTRDPKLTNFQNRTIFRIQLPCCGFK